MQPSPMNHDAVRWYVLVSTDAYRGKTDSLKTVHDLWEKRGETAFDYLAPRCKEMVKRGGQLKVVERPLMFNYVFVHASVRTIWAIQKVKPLFSFLQRVTTGSEIHYPYLTDAEMQNLQWVVRSYENELPIFTPKPTQLVKGDKVRINRGRFAGAVAEVVITPGRESRDVMVCLDNCFTIPLIGVSEDDYEIISLNKEGKHNYFQLNDLRLMGDLYEALRSWHANSQTTLDDEARRLALNTVSRFASISDINTDIMRVRQYCMLLPAYRLSGMDDRYNEMYSMLVSLDKVLTATKIRPLLYLTLYACTDSFIWHQKVHEAVSHIAAGAVKKTDAFVIEQLALFDKAYGHES